MKFVLGARAIIELLNEYGFEGVLYIILGLIIMAVINAAISIIPAGIAKLFSEDSDMPKAVFTISFIVLFVIEFIAF